MADPYLYPGSEILINLLNEHNEKVLNEIEKTSARVENFRPFYFFAAQSSLLVIKISTISQTYSV